MNEEQLQQRKSFMIGGWALLGAFAVAIAIFAILDVEAGSITKVISGVLLVGAAGAFGGAAKIKRDAKAAQRNPGPSNHSQG